MNDDLAKIEFIGHTADVRMQVSAASPEEVLKGALRGMNHLIKPGFCDDSSLLISTDLRIESVDRSALIVDTLSEILTETQIRKVLFCEMEIQIFQEIQLSARLYGRKIHNGFDEDLKAVTYHEAQLRKNQDGDWTITIIFDI